MTSQSATELSEQEREYIVNDVLAVKEAIAQLRAEGKICKIPCSCCKQRYRIDCISENFQLLEARLKKSQNMKGDNHDH